MMMRRKRGTGTIEDTPDGRFRPRLPGRGARLEVCDTYEEAQRTLDAALLAIDDGLVRVGDDTLVGFGKGVLERREIAGLRDSDSETSRWNTHVVPFFRGQRLTAVKRASIVEWRDAMILKTARPGKGHKTAPTRTISRSMVQNTLNLLRGVLGAAVDRGLIKSNPAADVKLPRGKGATHEPWTYLLPSEQRALLVCASERQRLMIAFALGTGMREGEQWNLELADVDLDDNRLTVRYGSNGKPRKNGKILRIKMLPLARAALDGQLALLKRDAAAWEKKHPGETFNPHGLVWPNTRGERRSKGGPSWWADLLDRIGLVPERRHDRRAVRWHDLRHTCASSLVAGWWGRRWSLEEIRAALGHSSIVISQRYAHLAESAVDVAVQETVGRSLYPWDDRPAKKLSHLRDLNSRPTVYELVPPASSSAELGGERGTLVGLPERAEEARRAIAYGGPEGWRKAWDLLTELAEAGEEKRVGRGRESA